MAGSADYRLEGVDILLAVDVEAVVSLFVGDAVLVLGAVHHAVASDEVVEHMIQDGFQGIFVDLVELNLRVGGDLNLGVSSGEEDESAITDLAILLPLI